MIVARVIIAINVGSVLKAVIVGCVAFVLVACVGIHKTLCIIYKMCMFYVMP